MTLVIYYINMNARFINTTKGTQTLDYLIKTHDNFFKKIQ